MFLKILVSLFVSLYAIGAGAEINLTFGTYTSDKPTAMVKKFRPVLNKLEAEISLLSKEKVNIKLHVARSYSDGINDLVSGRVDLARLGPASYIEAKQTNPAIELLVMESKNGKKRFNGVICVTEDSNITSIHGLKNTRFAFGNQKSTIGRYLAQSLFMRHGIYAKDFKSFDYLDRHDIVGYAVASKHYDAGAMKESTYKKLVKKGRPLKVIATFENVTKPWVSRAKLPVKIHELIKRALLNISNKSANKILKKFTFIEGDDSEYNFVRDAINNNNKFAK